MLTEAQVAKAKRDGWNGPLIDWSRARIVSAHSSEGRYQAVFVGGPLDGQTVGVGSFAPTRLVRLGGKQPGKPVAFRGGAAPPGRWAVYDLRVSNGAEVPVYDFKRERGRT